MMMKKIICAGLCSVLMLSMLSGCGKNDIAEENIELVEPVGVTANYVTVERRDLVSSKIYNGKVVPAVYESSFVGDQKFERFGSLLGTEVKKGDALLYASTESVDDQIKTLKDKMNDNSEAYEEQIKDYRKNLDEAVSQEKFWKDAQDRLDHMSATELSGRHDIDLVRNNLALSVSSRMRLEADIEKTTKLYDLDREYNELSLKRLKEDRNKLIATAPIEGTVVSIGFYENGAYIQKDTNVAAVGDFNHLEVKVDYVYKSDIKRAVDFYAVSNGVRYNATFIEPDTEVAPTAGATDASAFSTFVLDDPEGNVKAGDFVSIVLINKVSEDALCVPSEAINTDADGSFVYVYDGEKTSYRQIKTGLKNGLYTEVLSGLEEGEVIVSEFKVKPGKSTMTLEKGTVSTHFKADGYIFYSKVENIKNEIEYGTTYIKELCVKRYQKVSKGDVLAYIYVTPDSISIERAERNVLRAKEDLDELLLDEEKNEKLIKNKKEVIADMEDTLNHMKKDAKTTTVVAPFDGIITDTGWFTEGDIIKKDAFLCALAEEKNCFIYAEDQAGQLTYGNEVSIAYDGKTAIGTVVNVAPCALSEELGYGYSFIRVSSETLAEMADPGDDFAGYWFRKRFDVTAQVRSVENVVLVPKKAVTSEGGITYVTVLDENNNYVLKSFIAGGADSTNYWVADGLSEGTKICLE